MTKNSPCEFNLGMSDTDSFLFEVTKPKLFWKSVEPYMDFSNYDKDHPKFSEGNKAKLGFFKDELCGGKKCVEFIGLRPKCYVLYDFPQFREPSLPKLGKIIQFFLFFVVFREKSDEIRRNLTRFRRVFLFLLPTFGSKTALPNPGS